MATLLCLLLCQCLGGPAGRWISLRPTDRVVVSYQQGSDGGLRQTLCGGSQFSAREAYSKKGADPGEGKAYAAGPDDPIPLGEGGQTITTRQLLETLVPSPGPGREFDPRTLFLRRVVIPDTLTAEYRHYRLSDGIWFPRLMEIKDATGSFSLKLLLRDPSINQGLVPGALTLDLPEGVEVVRKNE